MTPRQPQVAAIVPAYNEEARIGRTVRALRQIPALSEVIVVDDGSTDRTGEVAESAGVRVIKFESNKGKGAALNRGAAETAAPVLLLVDADISESADQAACLLKPVLAGEADMAIATFPVIPGKGGGMGLVVRVAQWGIRRTTGREMQAPLSGQRAVRREVINRIGGFERGFGVEVALTIDALRAGFRVVEVPLTMTHRVTGRDFASICHRARQLIAVARALWKRR